MSGEGRFVVSGCTFECDRGHKYIVTYMPKRRDWDNQTCVYCREEDRDAEVERLTEAEGLLRDSCSEPLPLARWVAEGGINYCSSCSEQDGDGHAVGCWWVRRDGYFEKRRESGDDR